MVCTALDATENGLDFGDAHVTVGVGGHSDKQGACGPSQRLGNNGKINAFHAVLENEVAHDPCNSCGGDNNKEQATRRKGEKLPDKRQFCQTADVHKVRNLSAGSLHFQVHGHGISAQGKIQAVTKAQNSSIAPDQIDTDGYDGKANALAQEQNGGTAADHAQHQEHRHHGQDKNDNPKSNVGSVSFE